MQSRPPQPNNPPPPIEPTGFFTGIKIRPVIIGVVVDIVATMVLSTLYYFIFVAKDLSDQSAISEEALTEYWSSSEGIIASLMIGTFATAIGGFYAARKAGALEMKHGGLVGVGSILTGIILQSAGENGTGLNEWQMLIAYAAAIPAGALGGSVAEWARGFSPKKPRGGGTWPGH
jgi:putative membrane protein (TIGR04086 family)